MWVKLAAEYISRSSPSRRRLYSFVVSLHPSLNLSIDDIFIQPTKANMAAPNVLNVMSRWAIPVFIAISVGQSAIYDVRGGSRAVIFDRIAGVKEQVVNEGTHFLVPWLQKAIIYDVRTKPRNISTTTGSKDLQMVSLTLRVLHRPEVQRLPKIYQVSPITMRRLDGETNDELEPWPRLRRESPAFDRKRSPQIRHCAIRCC